ncbi:MAG: hypothetical protein FWE64_03365 [Alphaproteobacteria bacterium]|nr:hypothetical protein [Alphaproteobacteria bacterium]
MLDHSLIVSSAVSTFNNAALVSPGFFWSAILALPLVALGWIMAPEIAQRFAPNAKNRDKVAAFVAVLVIAGWALFHENFAVLRDGTSLVGILVAFILWIASTWMARRYYESGRRLSALLPNKKWGRKLDYFAPTIVVAIAFAFTIGAGRDESILQAGAVMIGIFTGYMLNRRNVRDADPRLPVAVMLTLGIFGLVMQPEFFRFGQLANLTLMHMIFLCLAMAASAVFFALHFVRPRGWFVKIFYTKMFLRALTVLVLALLFITESAPIFGALFAMVFVITALSALHASEKNAEALKKIKGEMWLVALGLFGVLAALPALVFVAAVMWRLSPRNDFVGKVRTLL